MYTYSLLLVTLLCVCYFCIMSFWFHHSRNHKTQCLVHAPTTTRKKVH